jgi:HK97 gp10 family phage protein
MKVTISGLRELDRALSEMSKATARNVLRRVAKGAVEPMAVAAEAGAPRDTGNLQISIAVSFKRTRRAGKSRATYQGNGNFRGLRATGVAVAMGPAGGSGALSYATWVEFGTSDTRAQPFMRPAWDAHKQGALEHVVQELRVEVDKAAARAARRASRKAAA